MGPDFTLSVHLPNTLTYADIEDAITGAGFASYGISRNLNFDGSSEVQVNVHNGQLGTYEAFDAVELLGKLSAVLNSLNSAEPTPTPPAPEQPDNGGGSDSGNDSGDEPGDNTDNS